MKISNEVIELHKAIILATNAHTGQFRKDSDEPYIMHPLRVMMVMETLTQKTAAVLHDVVEDTDVTLDGLIQRGFSERIYDIVEVLTKREGENYFDYVKRSRLDPDARIIKKADIQDNLREPFLFEDSMKERYQKALSILD